MVSCSHLKLPRLVQAGTGAPLWLEKLIHPAERILILSDSNVASLPHTQVLIDAIHSHTKETVLFTDIPAEPSVTDVEAACAACRAYHAQRIVAIGGGSVMDTAKLIGVLDTTHYSLIDLLENPALAQRTAPTLMIPTTAGTGAEATPNAIVTVPEQQLKHGIVNDALIADTVVLDADMLCGIPSAVAAATGIDALAHAVECFTSKKATLFSDLFAMEAFRLIERRLETLCADTHNCCAQTRLDMLTAAFYAGAAIACSGTTGVHALSYPLGGKYHIPHGIANASLLMPVMTFNEPACRSRLALLYDRIRPWQPLGHETEKSRWVLDRMAHIIHTIGIPPTLARYGVSARDLDVLTDAGMQVTRLLNNNPRPITPDDARRIYMQILGEEGDTL